MKMSDYLEVFNQDNGSIACSNFWPYLPVKENERRRLDGAFCSSQKLFAYETRWSFKRYWNMLNRANDQATFIVFLMKLQTLFHEFWPLLLTVIFTSEISEFGGYINGPETL